MCPRHDFSKQRKILFTLGNQALFDLQISCTADQLHLSDYSCTMFIIRSMNILAIFFHGEACEIIRLKVFAFDTILCQTFTHGFLYLCIDTVGLLWAGDKLSASGPEDSKESAFTKDSSCRLVRSMLYLRRGSLERILVSFRHLTAVQNDEGWPLNSPIQNGILE
ncbi:hypothetical protein AVEN_246586-1 [Araneus ventricosus]|uniref:Uncharacterized protein n=1 Tax=Araneus ventricosus TaxID=182803 RepID=A0A4Y2DCA6_ARAVE|nr:hypothetical protein AVEN_246586-1 [Araneus ventricosus]